MKQEEVLQALRSRRDSSLLTHPMLSHGDVGMHPGEEGYDEGPTSTEKGHEASMKQSPNTPPLEAPAPEMYAKGVKGAVDVEMAKGEESHGPSMHEMLGSRAPESSLRGKVVKASLDHEEKMKAKGGKY